MCVQLVLAVCVCTAGALENGVNKAADLTPVLTNLLVQLDAAVTTSHQCFTKEVFDKDDKLAPAGHVLEYMYMYIACRALYTVHVAQYIYTCTVHNL